jgi:threonine synthase
VIATNDNDILARAVATGEYRTRTVIPTTSPSMDIQVSSNFERLLFEASGRDAASVRRMMAGLRQSGGFTIEAGTLEKVRAEFDAAASTMAETAETIRTTLARSGYLLDPHTATGVRTAALRADRGEPTIIVGTAHPAKFPAAVEAACGVSPALPAWLDGLMTAEEKFAVLPSDLKMLEDYVGRHARAAGQGVRA